MTHKIWHFWGGNKSDASTTSDNTVNDIAPLESETSGNRAATLDAWNLAKGGDSGASTWIDGVMNRSNSDPEKAYLLTLAKEDNIELNNPIKTWDTANPDLYKSAKNAEPKKIHSFTNPRLGYEAATDVLNSMKMEGRFNGDRISYLYNQHTEGNTTDPIYNYVKQHGVGVINGESRRISDAFYGKDAVTGYGGPLDTTENGEPYNRGFDYVTSGSDNTKLNYAYIGDWSENALNEIDVATYHLTLWIDRKQDIQRNTYRNSGVVIAESGGSTFFNIDNLEITTISGSADQVTNVAPAITFTLTEPNGAAFFPKLLEVCRKKDIPTLQQAGYVLEVRFKGRNKTTGLPTKLPYMWKYNLAAIQVATKHNINASTYNFTSATMSNEPGKASWNILSQTISLTETNDGGDETITIAASGETKPTITGISPTTITNTASNIVITGTNYVITPNVEFIASTGVITLPNSIVRDSATQLTVNVTLPTDGTYFIRVENPDGLAVRSGSALLTVSDAPTWSTSAGSLGSVAAGASVSLDVDASSDSTVAFSETTSVLTSNSNTPASTMNLTLNSSTGAITGTAPAATAETTYNFTLRATDAESQTADRAFSITVTVGINNSGGFN